MFLTFNAPATVSYTCCLVPTAVIYVAFPNLQWYCVVFRFWYGIIPVSFVLIIPKFIGPCLFWRARFVNVKMIRFTCPCRIRQIIVFSVSRSVCSRANCIWSEANCIAFWSRSFLSWPTPSPSVESKLGSVLSTTLWYDIGPYHTRFRSTGTLLSKFGSIRSLSLKFYLAFKPPPFTLQWSLFARLFLFSAVDYF